MLAVLYIPTCCKQILNVIMNVSAAMPALIQSTGHGSQQKTNKNEKDGSGATIKKQVGKKRQKCEKCIGCQPIQREDCGECKPCK